MRESEIKNKGKFVRFEMKIEKIINVTVFAIITTLVLYLSGCIEFYSYMGWI